MIIDVSFCILYLIEMQFNLSNFDQIPRNDWYRWLYVARPDVIYHIILAFSFYNLLSLILRLVVVELYFKRFCLWNLVG